MLNIEQIKNTILQGDTNNLIKQIPSNSIDLIVTDPPYLIKSGGGKFRDDRPYLQQVSEESNFCDGFDDNFLNECKRVLKKFNGYFFCNKKQIKQYLDFAYENDYFFDILTWIKTNPSPLCNHTYLPDTEYIIFIREKGVGLYTTYKTANKYWVTSVQKNNFDHPTSKPTFLMDRMIINSSREGDVILDTFFGTGSTGVSAKELNRNFIGIEMMPKYVGIASDRLNCPVDIINVIEKPGTTAVEINGECKIFERRSIIIDELVRKKVESTEAQKVLQPNVLMDEIKKVVKENSVKRICDKCGVYTDDNGNCKYCDTIIEKGN